MVFVTLLMGTSRANGTRKVLKNGLFEPVPRREQGRFVGEADLEGRHDGFGV
jgi:hypothetical protein